MSDTILFRQVRAALDNVAYGVDLHQKGDADGLQRHLDVAAGLITRAIDERIRQALARPWELRGEVDSAGMREAPQRRCRRDWTGGEVDPPGLR